MKILLVVSLDIPTDQLEQLPAVLAAIDPPSIRYFDGKVRVIPEPYSTVLLAAIDEETEPRDIDARGDTMNIPPEAGWRNR